MSGGPVWGPLWVYPRMCGADGGESSVHRGDSECVISPDAKVKAKALYEAWQVWAMCVGFTAPFPVGSPSSRVRLPSRWCRGSWNR